MQVDPSELVFLLDPGLLFRAVVRLVLWVIAAVNILQRGRRF